MVLIHPCLSLCASTHLPLNLGSLKWAPAQGSRNKARVNEIGSLPYRCPKSNWVDGFLHRQTTARGSVIRAECVWEQQEGRA